MELGLSSIPKGIATVQHTKQVYHMKIPKLYEERIEPLVDTIVHQFEDA